MPPTSKPPILKGVSTTRTNRIFAKLVERVKKLDEMADPNFNQYTDFLLGYRKAAVKFVAEDLEILTGIPATELIELARKNAP